MTNMGKSRRIKCALTVNGTKKAQSPNTKPTLTIFEPIPLPIASSPAPLIAAMDETSNSGAEVPKATTVMPIKDIDTLQCLAKVAELAMRRSALIDKAIRPTASARIGKTIESI